ncbi:MAG TPA: hypothetical protein VFR09_00345 [Alphaproteobacteria bacterium]|nr:hypothetical protein [Alphaproteobacteria bacterium]
MSTTSPVTVRRKLILGALDVLARSLTQKSESDFQQTRRKLETALRKGDIYRFVRTARQSYGVSVSFDRMFNDVLKKAIQEGNAVNFVRAFSALGVDCAQGAECAVVETIHADRIGEAARSLYSTNRQAFFELEKAVTKAGHPEFRRIYTAAFKNAYEQIFNAEKKRRMESGQIGLVAKNASIVRTSSDRPALRLAPSYGVRTVG